MSLKSASSVIVCARSSQLPTAAPVIGAYLASAVESRVGARTQGHKDEINSMY